MSKQQAQSPEEVLRALKDATREAREVIADFKAERKWLREEREAYAKKQIEMMSYLELHLPLIGESVREMASQQVISQFPVWSEQITKGIEVANEHVNELFTILAVEMRKLLSDFTRDYDDANMAMTLSIDAITSVVGHDEVRKAVHARTENPEFVAHLARLIEKRLDGKIEGLGPIDVR